VAFEHLGHKLLDHVAPAFLAYRILAEAALGNNLIK
jgi:hypothetical protein